MNINRKKVSPILLTCLSCIGVIATTMLAIRATPKALDKIKEDSRTNHSGDPDAYTYTEAVKSAWHYYIPTAITGVATITCIFGINALNKKQQAAIASAYVLINESYNNYVNKTKEIFGEEGHQQILDAITAEKAKDVYISSSGFCSTSTLAFNDRDQEDKKLFYDSFSKRYFESTLAQVLEAEHHLNRNWTLGADVNVNDFYDFLGIGGIPGGNDLYWFYADGINWIDFNHHKTTLDDGLEVFVIDIYDPLRLENEFD